MLLFKCIGSSVYTVASAEDQIKMEMMKNGPVQTAFTVYADFPTYKYEKKILRDIIGQLFSFVVYCLSNYV